MGRVLATLSGVLVLALLAGGLTEAALAVGHRGGISDDAKLRPQARESPAVRSMPSIIPTPSPTATPAPTVSPSPVAILPKAVTNSFVHMRASNSTNSAILYDLNAGTVVNLLPVADAQWQEVQYAGSVGYIYRSYLTY
jgi:hypothetical protein